MVWIWLSNESNVNNTNDYERTFCSIELCMILIYPSQIRPAMTCVGYKRFIYQHTKEQEDQKDQNDNNEYN